MLIAANIAGSPGVMRLRACQQHFHANLVRTGGHHNHRYEDKYLLVEVWFIDCAVPLVVEGSRVVDIYGSLCAGRDKRRSCITAEFVLRLGPDHPASADAARMGQRQGGLLAYFGHSKYT